MQYFKLSFNYVINIDEIRELCGFETGNFYNDFVFSDSEETYDKDENFTGTQLTEESVNNQIGLSNLCERLSITQIRIYSSREFQKFDKLYQDYTAFPPNPPDEINTNPYIFDVDPIIIPILNFDNRHFELILNYTNYANEKIIDLEITTQSNNPINTVISPVTQVMRSDSGDGDDELSILKEQIDIMKIEIDYINKENEVLEEEKENIVIEMNEKSNETVDMKETEFFFTQIIIDRNNTRIEELNDTKKYYEKRLEEILSAKH